MALRLDLRFDTTILKFNGGAEFSSVNESLCRIPSSGQPVALLGSSSKRCKMQKAITEHLKQSPTGGKNFMSISIDKYPIMSEFGLAISSLINTDIASSTTKCHGFLNQKCEFVPTENLCEFQSLEEREELKKFIKARRSTELSSKNSGPQIIPTTAQSKNTATNQLVDKL